MNDSRTLCERFEVIHRIITILVPFPTAIFGLYYFFNDELTDMSKLIPLLVISTLFIIYASIHEIKCNRPHFFEFFKLRREMKEQQNIQ
ncbi:MAG: hypothetical protein HeimC2_21230 [Candidatus Heimdallarchaeota archaeon LC_2]|nr:MAG: hypothetical protein HeimC2_21230 [Candidatus Heimdallarchaeota archaeon LC_2]